MGGMLAVWWLQRTLLLLESGFIWSWPGMVHTVTTRTVHQLRPTLS